MLRTFLAILMTLSLSSATYAKVEPKPKVRTITLTAENTIAFNMEINDVSVNTFIHALVGARTALPKDQTLNIIIASPGGQIGSTVVLLRFLRKMPNTQVICKYCASAAGVMFARSGLHRIVIKKSELMMHEAYVNHVTAKNMQDMNIVQGLIRASEEFNRAMYTLIGITKEEYEAKIVDKEWTVKGNEIVKLNLADEYAVVRCDEYIASLMPDTCSQ